MDNGGFSSGGWVALFGSAVALSYILIQVVHPDRTGKIGRHVLRLEVNCQSNAQWDHNGSCAVCQRQETGFLFVVSHWPTEQGTHTKRKLQLISTPTIPIQCYKWQNLFDCILICWKSQLAMIRSTLLAFWHANVCALELRWGGKSSWAKNKSNT